MKKFFLLLLTLLLLVSCSLAQDETSASTPTALPIPIEGDSETPLPLDANVPVAYKGLTLVMQDNGEPTVAPVDGVIGVVCIGMSNARLECNNFIGKWKAGAFADEINPQVRFVNCAAPGNGIENWNDKAYDKLWASCIREEIPAAGLRPDQVRVVWHKAADLMTLDETGAAYPAYPDPRADYFRFYDNLTAFAGRLLRKIPSVQAVYVTSRSYGGYTSEPGLGEPLSFEEGLALDQWLADHPSVNGVWFGWGPYIWAPSCSTGMVNGSGVCYLREDYQADGIHPAQGALDKVTMMLHERFSRHRWYRGEKIPH